MKCVSPNMHYHNQVRLQTQSCKAGKLIIKTACDAAFKLIRCSQIASGVETAELRAEPNSILSKYSNVNGRLF